MLRTATAVSAVALLAGCNVGSSTYGTGVSQESQLVSDLASVVSFKQKKKAQIDYSERDKIVKPGRTSELPAPIETNEASAAFPGDSPTVAHGAKPRIDRGEGLSAEDRKYLNYRGPMTKGYQAWVNKRLAKQREAKAAAGRTNGGRRYFTEPPSEYRRAYESAPKGDVGRTEDSKDFRKKSKGNIFSRLLRRG